MGIKATISETAGRIESRPTSTLTRWCFIRYMGFDYATCDIIKSPHDLNPAPGQRLSTAGGTLERPKLMRDHHSPLRGQ